MPWKNVRSLFHIDQFDISKDLEGRVENVYAHTTLFYYCLMTQIAIITVINISCTSISSHLVKALLHTLNTTWMS